MNLKQINQKIKTTSKAALHIFLPLVGWVAVLWACAWLAK